jgi:hypothetical protein
MDSIVNERNYYCYTLKITSQSLNVSIEFHKLGSEQQRTLLLMDSIVIVTPLQSLHSL